MRLSAALIITALSFCMPAGVFAATKPAAQVKSAKGPVQLTVSLRKTKVRVNKTLWYKLELKNIGRTKLKVDDLIFKNPWAMHENCSNKMRIYIEVIASNGKPMRVQSDGEPVKYDWEPHQGEAYRLTADEKNEVEALTADWKKRGLTEHEQRVAYNDWNQRFHRRKNLAERRNPAKQLWLNPGASTATFAWADRGPDDYEGRDEDDRALNEGYAQLWSYRFLTPGIYRVRATYDFSFGGDLETVYAKRELFRKGLVTFSTPFMTIEVLP